jgi:hypothetical protein
MKFAERRRRGRLNAKGIAAAPKITNESGSGTLTTRSASARPVVVRRAGVVASQGIVVLVGEISPLVVRGHEVAIEVQDKRRGR